MKIKVTFNLDFDKKTLQDIYYNVWSLITETISFHSKVNKSKNKVHSRKSSQIQFNRPDVHKCKQESEINTSMQSNVRLFTKRSYKTNKIYA